MANVEFVDGDLADLAAAPEDESGERVSPAAEEDASYFSGQNEDHSKPSDPSVQARKWQSIADKREAKVKQLEAEMASLKSVSPIKQLLDQRPDLMAVIERELLAAGKPKVEPLTKPEPPRRPAGYDEAEAISNPESASFKYRLQKEEYLERLTEYQDKRNAQLEADLRAQAEAMEGRVRAREQDASLRAQLASKGITGESADRFIANFTQTGKLSLDDLVKFHFLKEGKLQINGNPARKDFEPPPLVKAPSSYRDDEGKEIDASAAFSRDLARGAGRGKDLFRTS